jgi:uncharacterized protein YkwD
MRTPGLLVGVAAGVALAAGVVVATTAGAQTTAPVTGSVGGDEPGVQQEVLALVNDARRSSGCPPLAVNTLLVEAAREHAVDMADRGYFAHRDPSGEGAGDRVSDTGYDWATYAENIARGQDSPAEVVDDWLHSPVHRENIMTCAHTEVGVGLAFDADHRPYWVQDLASPHVD